jgi:nicotinamide riboside kinase
MAAFPHRRGHTRVIRVVLTGSESTGKTMLAARLAEHFGAALVAEFLRPYALRKGAALEFDDQEPTARGQMALEDEQTTLDPPLIVQDTDLLSYIVYSDHYFGKRLGWLDAEAHARRPDLYLLCEIDVDWIADGVRDRAHMREAMQQYFRDAVAASGAPSVRITGSWHERFRQAVDAIDSLRVTRSPRRA